MRSSRCGDSIVAREIISACAIRQHILLAYLTNKERPPSLCPVGFGCKLRHDDENTKARTTSTAVHVLAFVNVAMVSVVFYFGVPLDIYRIRGEKGGTILCE